MALPPSNRRVDHAPRRVEDSGGDQAPVRAAGRGPGRGYQRGRGLASGAGRRRARQRGRGLAAGAGLVALAPVSALGGALASGGEGLGVPRDRLVCFPSVRPFPFHVACEH